MDNDTIIFSRNLVKLMRSKNLIQEDVASMLNVPRSSVANWTSGRNIPRPPILKKLAKLLNVSIDNLLNEEIIGRETVDSARRKKNIINNIKYLIDIHDLEEEEFAKIAGVDVEMIILWLSGKRSVPFENAMRICDYFSIRPEDFIDKNISRKKRP